MRAGDDQANRDEHERRHGDGGLSAKLTPAKADHDGTASGCAWPDAVSAARPM